MCISYVLFIHFSKDRKNVVLHLLINVKKIIMYVCGRASRNMLGRVGGKCLRKVGKYTLERKQVTDGRKQICPQGRKEESIRVFQRILVEILRNSYCMKERDRKATL